MLRRSFLLTDIVRYANDGGSIVKAYKTNDPVEVTGINTFSQLAGSGESIAAKNGATTYGPGRSADGSCTD